jgi:queuine tRNA-ribosyltransferase-like protein
MFNCAQFGQKSLITNYLEIPLRAIPFAPVSLRTDPSGARPGRLATPHGVMDTPAFMPVGTASTMKGLPEQALAHLSAQILELWQKLQRDLSLTYLLISHSLPVIAQLTTSIAVMQRCRIVEAGPAEQVLSPPAHPYVQSLIVLLRASVAALGR